MRPWLLAALLLGGCNVGPHFYIDASNVALRGPLGVLTILQGPGALAETLPSSVDGGRVRSVTLPRDRLDWTDRCVEFERACTLTVIAFEDRDGDGEWDNVTEPEFNLDKDPIIYRPDLDHTDAGWLTAGYFTLDAAGDKHALDGPTFVATPALFNVPD